MDGAPVAEVLRFTTAGSVDDGKSTLIGRLLHDSRNIADDQLAALEQASRRRGAVGIDLSLLTDGLRAEREQGITIDVAYRYFATPRRKFIIADTPGHVQYTRNMVTGASTAGLAIVLLDARKGVLEQTRRHLVIATLLGVPHIVGAVNKMDLVGYDHDVFARIQAEFTAIAARLGSRNVQCIPISALLGDNVVDRSREMPWYDGPALLEHLEAVPLGSVLDFDRQRFPVQWIIRGPAEADPGYRAYAGRIDAGSFRPGDEVLALPSAIRTRITSIDTLDGSLPEAVPPQSVAIRLADDVDVPRGGMLVGIDDIPSPRTELEVTACWLADEPAVAGRRFLLQHTSRTVRASVVEVIGRLDVNDLTEDLAAERLGPNDVGRIRLVLAEPIYPDAYWQNRVTGSAILIDETTNATVAGLLLGERPAPD